MPADRAPQGIHAFLRAYYHLKSADWTKKAPVPLKAFTAHELAKLPSYSTKLTKKHEEEQVVEYDR